MAIIIASLAPVFIILFYIYFRDKYDKEPIGLLVKSLVVGMLTVIPIFYAERFLVSITPPLGKVANSAYNAFLVAGSTEELFKYIALYLLVWKSRHFNEKFDGIVYAVFVSLGFAAVENVMYVMNSGVHIAITRAITAVPAHAIFGITMGYYFGIAHMYTEIRTENLIKAVLIPILLHGIYDFILMVGVGWLLMFFVPYVIYLYSTGIKKMKVLSDASIFKPMEEED